MRPQGARPGQPCERAHHRWAGQRRWHSRCL